MLSEESADNQRLTPYLRSENSSFNIQFPTSGALYSSTSSVDVSGDTVFDNNFGGFDGGERLLCCTHLSLLGNTNTRIRSTGVYIHPPRG